MTLTWRLYCADAAAALRDLPAASVHAIVTDPPAGVAFMGKDWDGDKGGRDAWVAWLADVMREALRVLKPGGHGVVWALPRTSHWTATALEDAGFEIRDVVVHLFGSGFPKSLDVSKAIDALHGAKREIVGTEKMRDISNGRGRGHGENLDASQRSAPTYVAVSRTVAASDDAKRWAGYGTALKPAAEHWILVRKPLNEPSVARNVLTHGSGALNIDAARIRGRYPANVVLSHHPLCEIAGERVIDNHDKRPGREGLREGGFADVGAVGGNGKPCGPLYGTETVEVWDCVPGCAVAQLDVQSGTLVSGKPSGLRNATGYFGGGHGMALPGYGDRGGASRFFYVAKPSKGEKQDAVQRLSLFDRDADVKPLKNTHPTVKGVELMRYLCRLVTPAGGVVLDPFAGSGSTGVAALAEGCSVVLIERDPDYAAAARARMERAAFDTAAAEGAA